MTAAVQPFHEPLRATLARTVLIAVVAGTLLAALSARSARPIGWPVAVLVMLWPSLGGHYLEVWYLNWLRPRLPAAPVVQRVARLGTWFLGGWALGVAMALTVNALGGIRPPHWRVWWLAGVAFIGIELIPHTLLQARGRPSFFNGRG